MPFTISPGLIENNYIEITTDESGNPQLRNKATDETFTLTGELTADTKADVEGGGTATLSGYASVETESLQTTEATIGDGPTIAGTQNFGITELKRLGQIGTLNAEGKPLTEVSEFGGLFINAGEFETLQHAVDYAEDNNIGTVWVPAGRYAGPVVLNTGGVTLRGESKLNTIIDGGSGRGIVFKAHHATAENLRVETDGTTGGTAIDLETELNRYARIRDVLITECGGTGISANFTFTQILSCDVRSCGDSEIRLGGSTQRCIVDNCWVEGTIENIPTGTGNRVTDANIQY